MASWAWGNGSISARRELHLPRWWPAGGNGGKGWSVIFVATKDENTLLPYRFRKIFKADGWQAGMSREQYGKNAEDLILPVPVGTIIKDLTHDRIIAHLEQDHDQITVVQWWQWGVGNMHFKDSIRQYPNFALLWEPWHELELELELQLLWDVALIGTPSVGKSTIINAVSNTKAKVADYPFTTLIPNLWSVKHYDTTFNMVDVPGLIAGASEGRWLGNAFLRHILKAPVWAFVTDVSRYESGLQDVGLLIQELMDYIDQRMSEEWYDQLRYQWNTDPQTNQLMLTIWWSSSMMDSVDGESEAEWFVEPQQQEYHNADTEICLIKKTFLFVINKIDLFEDQEMRQEYISIYTRHISDYLLWLGVSAREMQPIMISGVTREGVSFFLDQIVQILNQRREDLSDRLVRDHGGLVVASMPTTRDYTKILVDVTADEVDYLIEQWYIDPEDDESMTLEHIKVREIHHPELARLVWITMRGNDEAEMWFWGIINKQWLIRKWTQQWLEKGHILKIVSFYEGRDDRYVVY